LFFKGKDGGMSNEVIANGDSNKHPTHTDDDDDDEEDDEPVYIEISPCSRWQKRRETVNNKRMSFFFLSFFLSFLKKFQVAQRDIPGIDASYLAMDTEEGVEVVWNEVLFSERKISDSQHVCSKKKFFFFSHCLTEKIN